MPHIFVVHFFCVLVGSNPNVVAALWMLCVVGRSLPHSILIGITNQPIRQNTRSLRRSSLNLATFKQTIQPLFVVCPLFLPLPPISLSLFLSRIPISMIIDPAYAQRDDVHNDFSVNICCLWHETNNYAWKSWWCAMSICNGFLSYLFH